MQHEGLRIWMDGGLVEYERATTHVLSHTLHYGLGVFEGIRAYETRDGRTAVFRLTEHVKRLFDSCHSAMIPMPYSKETVFDAILEVVRENKLTACYVRPLVWLGEGSIRVAPTDNKIHVAIAAWPWGPYLGRDAIEKGIRCKMSSYARIGVRSHLEKAKVCGQYVNSVLAKREANLDGYDEAILMDAQGYVTEGTGENVFVVRDRVVYTPPRGASILVGITRDTVLMQAREAGLDAREQSLTRSDLYTADEIFLTGTAAEVTPVREIDGRTIGSGAMGPVTARIQRDYFATVRGENDRHLSWLSFV